MVLLLTSFAVTVKLKLLPAVAEEGTPVSTKLLIGPAELVAKNEAAVPTPETEAVKVFAPTVVLEVGVQAATPLEFVVDEAQLATEAPLVEVAQVTAMPEPTALPLASLTKA